MMNFKRVILIAGLMARVWVSYGQDQVGPQAEVKGKLIFKADFNKKLDTAIWRVELEPAPGSFAGTQNGKLILKTGAGVTVWLRKQLKGNLLIVYKRKIVDQKGPFDRVSDLNQFWMASDAHGREIFSRKGKLGEYNNLRLYYAGMGGNTNSTTRFRKYDGTGNRALLAEYTDQQHLLVANQNYEISTRVINGRVSFAVNGVPFFSFTDPTPLTEGYFGFRSTKSNQEISGLSIYQLP